MDPITSDQASFMLRTLGLPALRNEHRLTSAIVAAIPNERWDYRPHADSRSAFELAWHIVSAEIKYLDAIAAGLFPHGFATFPAIVLLQLILNHTIHHRGQLSTYLRPMGAKMPPLYGPSHDTGGFPGGRSLA
jgi:uncharacterized damage-inducible protein DinB